MSWRVELLDPAHHDRSDFASGAESLDRYLTTHASQDGRRRVSATFCLIADDAPEVIVGYYTLSPGAIHLSGLPTKMQKRLPRYPDVPVYLLGRLAVDRQHQRRGIGSLLVHDALRRVLRQELPAVAVVVDAIDQAAVTFYRGFGFVPFPHQPSRLVLPVTAIPRDIEGVDAHG